MSVLAYRDPALFTELLRRVLPELARRVDCLGRKVRFMEVCGTHTVALSRTGVRQVLADYVELLSGPGCPVCVTDQADIDRMIECARQPETIVATFGDMVKVPGTVTSLYQSRTEGADVRIVYSPSEAVEIAKNNPSRQVIFLGVGFETTAPSVALSVQIAVREQVSNYLVYSAHKLTPPAVLAIAADPEQRLDGFLLPGHVSAVTGRRGWAALEALNQPAVISGFEPLDLLVSIYRLVLEMGKAKRTVVNNYTRVVTEDGNPIAQGLLAEVFTSTAAEWRGLGGLAASGLEIARAYAAVDAKLIAPYPRSVPRPNRGCHCGEIIKGKEGPAQCSLFARACTPESPVGPCMVSAEGACSAAYQYDREQGALRPPRVAGRYGRSS